MAANPTKLQVNPEDYELRQTNDGLPVCNNCEFFGDDINNLCLVNSMSTWRQQKFECMPEGKDGRPIMNLYWVKKETNKNE